MESSTREYSNTPEHEQHVGGGGGEAGGDFGGSGGDPNGADGGGGSVSGDSAGRNSGGSENGSILVGMNAADSSTQGKSPAPPASALLRSSSLPSARPRRQPQRSHRRHRP